MPASIPSNPPSGIALFDLDGTLLAWDCQLLFRHFVLRREPWRGVFLLLFLAALPVAGLLGTTAMKRVFLSYWWGLSPAKLARYSREFALVLQSTIYPELRQEIARHRAAGHLLILSSASPECYVTAIGRELGFDLALGTPVQAGPLFPPLVNNKGTAKVTRLMALLPPAYFHNGKLHHCHGYTDSRADLPMLELCTAATVVNPSPALTKIATNAGWTIVRPTRPWQSLSGFACRAIALLTGLGRDPASPTTRPE